MAFQKKQDKYNALWLSHSSLSDYLKCPRLYFLRNIWKNKNGRKVNIVSPAMSLGSAVHAVIEPLANLKTEERFTQDLISVFLNKWQKFSGEWGGFSSKEEEEDYKERGLEMIKNVIENKGPLVHKTVKFYNGDFIPNIYLSEKDNIILCGLVDWVEYLEDKDMLRVIDFKTGKNDEKDNSMQLPIYKILVESLQKRKVYDGAYWYLARDKNITKKELIDEDIEEVKNKILETGIEMKKIKDGSKNLKEMYENFKCKYGGCKSCNEMELIYNYNEDNEKIKYVGVGEYNQDLYKLNI